MKKHLSLFVALTLVSSVLSGCGDIGEAPVEATTTPEAESSVETSTPEPTTEAQVESTGEVVAPEEVPVAVDPNVDWDYVPFPVPLNEEGEWAREAIGYGHWEDGDMDDIYYTVLKHYVVNDFSSWYGEDGYGFKANEFGYPVAEGATVTYHNCDTNTCYLEFVDNCNIDKDNMIVSFDSHKDCEPDPTCDEYYIEYLGGTPCTAYMYIVVDPDQEWRVKEAYVSVDDYDWILQMKEEHPQT